MAAAVTKAVSSPVKKSRRIYVYSTLTADQNYTTWGDAPTGGIPTISHQVFIKGGANVATKHLVTPRGAVTEISEKDLEHLKMNDSFIFHEKRGHVIIDSIKVDPEVIVAKGMVQRDDSAPNTPESLPKGLPTLESKDN